MPGKKSRRRTLTGKSQEASLEKLTKNAELIDREIQEELSRHAPGKLGVLINEPELELGQRIQDARRMAGLTQGELAEKTKRVDAEGNGISGSVISLYERGVNRPGPREIRILCEALRISPNHLIYGDEDPFEGTGKYERYLGWARSEAELYAAMTYCLTRLHHHHKAAVMDLMMGLLRGWNKDFDREMDAKAIETYLQHADELRLELAKQREENS